MSSCINKTLTFANDALKIAGALPLLGSGIGFGRTFIAGSLWLGGTTAVLIAKLFITTFCLQREISLDDLGESHLAKLQDFNAKVLKQTAHGILELTCLKMPLAIALHQDADVQSPKNDEDEIPFCTLTENEVYYGTSNATFSSYKATHIVGCMPGFSLLVGSVRVITHLGLAAINISACLYQMTVACRAKDNDASNARDHLSWHAQALLTSNLYGIAIGITEILQLKWLMAGCWYFAGCADLSKK